VGFAIAFTPMAHRWFRRLQECLNLLAAGGPAAGASSQNVHTFILMIPIPQPLLGQRADAVAGGDTNIFEPKYLIPGI
jgi:hypothetical protein